MESTLSRLPKRFIDKIHVNPDTDCWEWTGCKNSMRYNYGMVHLDGKTWWAHIAVYTLLVGSVPEGLELDHGCRVTHCVAPHHLEPVTRQENIDRRPRPTHCPSGHEKTEENTGVLRTTGATYCKPCNRARANAVYARKTGKA